MIQFEHALMIFHRGFRLRTELYSQDFQQGILKATSIILNTIKTLDDYTEGPQPEKMIPNGKNVFLIRFKNYNIFKNLYSFWKQSTTSYSLTPIYLNLIFDSLQFGISSFLNWIFYLFWTGFLLPVQPAKIQFKL